MKHLRILIRNIMEEASDQGYIRSNPAKMLRVPKPKAVRRPFLTIDQVTALLKAAKWKPPVKVLRITTVCGLPDHKKFKNPASCF